MFRRHGLYWVWMPNCAPDDGAGNGGDGQDGTNDAGNGGDGQNGQNGQQGDNQPVDSATLAAELAKLKAEFAKQKAALDSATKEAGNYRKELRAKQTAEEIAAAEKKAAEEKAAQELDELRREVAKAKSVKTVMSKLGTDEEAAGKIAECLFGCENIEAALLEIQKVWAEKEKKLRLEFGKIPGPGAGNGNGENAAEKAALELAKKLGEAQAAQNKPIREGLSGYIR